MAGVSAIGAESFGEHFRPACGYGGFVGGLVSQAFAACFALGAGAAESVGVGGGFAGGICVCAVGRLFGADAAGGIDAGGVCLGLVAAACWFGVGGVVAGFGAGGQIVVFHGVLVSGNVDFSLVSRL